MALFVACCDYKSEAGWTSSRAGTDVLIKISAARAARYGLAIQAEAVLDADRSLVLIVEAAGRTQVEEFMVAFAGWGRVHVYPASSAEETAKQGNWRPFRQQHESTSEEMR